MQSRIKINFYYPDIKAEKKEDFISALVHHVPDDPEVGFAGFAEKEFLSYNLSARYEDHDLKKYQPFGRPEQERISTIITETLNKCFEKLPGEKAITVSIFPWLKEYDEFEGINGYTPFEHSFVLFIAQKFTEKSLIETVAHEFNHAIFFANHSSPQTLLDSFVSEGLAENFREEVVGGEVASWSKALNDAECQAAFLLLKDSLAREDMYEEVFWGSGKFKKWTGYSIGYSLIKSFRENERISWPDLMKMDSKAIFEKTKFGK